MFFDETFVRQFHRFLGRLGNDRMTIDTVGHPLSVK